MCFFSKKIYFHLSLFFFNFIILLGLFANVFALPIKTSILNAEEEKVGQALVYIDYVELQDLDGVAKGRLGFVNIKGGYQLFVVIDDGRQNLVGSAKNRRLYSKNGQLLAHYDWTTFWSYVYAPDGNKIGEAKCIAFRGICAAGIASYLTGLLDK
tara:strand:+ start:426 stop:890 length:465 start_codon:yes stop_codon:yes gene_type:complete